MVGCRGLFLAGVLLVFSLFFGRQLLFLSVVCGCHVVIVGSMVVGACPFYWLLCVVCCGCRAWLFAILYFPVLSLVVVDFLGC